ncbi:MAG: hypothetical protein ACOY71_00250 [Gemmatimonadota bacterium]
MMHPWKPLALVAFALLQPARAHAQGATMQVSVQVQQPLTVIKDRDLDLGRTFPNSTRAVQPTDPKAGAFALAGAPDAEVTINFTLPAYLTSGPDQLPIAFGPGAAGFNRANAPAGTTPFNPASPLTTRLDAGTGRLWVFVGGAVTPTSQPPGTYTGTITLNAAFTGN